MKKMDCVETLVMNPSPEAANKKVELTNKLMVFTGLKYSRPGHCYENQSDPLQELNSRHLRT